MTTKHFIQTYIEQRPLYKEFVKELMPLLNEQASKRGITFDIMEGRAKKVNSLMDKINRQGIKVPHKNIYDLAGVRIVCDFEDQKEPVRELIKELFTVT